MSDSGEAPSPAPAAPQPAPAAPQLAPALAISAAAALALSAAAVALVPLGNGAAEAAVSLARYLHNGFCLLILTLGLWGLFYALLQIHASTLEGRSLTGFGDASALLRRVTGALPYSALIDAEGVTDAGLRASIAADRFETHRALRAAPIAYAIWALPLLGFIGTVIGISGAIGGLGEVFGDSGREEALQGVLSHLRFAFDTTFVGLAMAIPTMAMASILKMRSDSVRHAMVACAVRPR